MNWTIFLLFVTILWKTTWTAETPESICKQFSEREEWTFRKDTFVQKLTDIRNPNPDAYTPFHYLLSPTTLLRFCKRVAVKEGLTESQNQRNVVKRQTLDRCSGSAANFVAFVADFIDYFHVRGATLIQRIKGGLAISIIKIFPIDIADFRYETSTSFVSLLVPLA